MKRKLKATILDILDAYTPCIGGVPLPMLEYHIQHHPDGAMDVTREELGEAIKELLQEKRISRDVVAYKKER
jgi:hypothetical protein